jgi:hypothetical protein
LRNLVTEIQQAYEAFLSASCRHHRDRAIRRMKAAVTASGHGTEAASPTRGWAEEAARFLAEECDDDPLALGLIERARTMGLI